MHVQTGCSGNDSDIVIPSLPCSDSQPADSPRFLMDGLGTKHRVWGIWSKGLQVKRSTSQKVPKSKGLQVKRSPSQKGYKSKGPQSKGLQKFESMKGIKESCTGKTFIIYSFIITCDS